MRTLITVFIALALLGCSGKDLHPPGYAPLTEAEVTRALKDALGRAIARSVSYAAQSDGYFANPELKIDLPEDAQTLENTLRNLGFGAEIDAAVKQINRSAELAAASAKPVFIKAITAMTFGDVFEVLNGEQDAATRYLMNSSRAEIFDQYRPIVVEALDETSAARYYGDIVERYNALPLNFDVDPDLADYVTGKAIDGLSRLMAREEAQIRNDSRARSTRLMKRVFGSLD